MGPERNSAWFFKPSAVLFLGVSSKMLVLMLSNGKCCQGCVICHMTISLLEVLGLSQNNKWLCF